jgi:ABC-type transporter Mla subunit MlaD
VIRQQAAEIERLRQILAQQAVDTLSEVVDGLNQVLAQAGRGDNSARHLLEQLSAQMEAARTLSKGIATPSRPGDGLKWLR